MQERPTSKGGKLQSEGGRGKGWSEQFGGTGKSDGVGGSSSNGPGESVLGLRRKNLRCGDWEKKRRRRVGWLYEMG